MGQQYRRVDWFPRHAGVRKERIGKNIAGYRKPVTSSPRVS